ncbi:MAG: sigma-70 family RNA polymerase sigma factor [Planctomycetota bacterium]
MRDQAAEQVGGRPSPDGDFTGRYQRVAPALYVWASLRIRAGLREYCEVDDLLQEAWCRAYAIRHRFDAAEVEFRPWLFRIAKNVLFEVKREARQCARAPHGQGRTSRLFVLEAVPDGVTSITRRLARDEALRRFRDRLDALPEEDRELVVLVGIEGASQADAAERLGMGYEALRKRWQRLRARLEAEGLPETLLD